MVKMVKIPKNRLRRGRQAIFGYFDHFDHTPKRRKSHELRGEARGTQTAGDERGAGGGVSAARPADGVVGLIAPGERRENVWSERRLREGVRHLWELRRRMLDDAPAGVFSEGDEEEIPF